MNIIESISLILSSATSSTVKMFELTEQTIDGTAYYVEAYGEVGQSLNSFVVNSKAEADTKAAITIQQLRAEQLQLKADNDKLDPPTE